MPASGGPICPNCGVLDGHTQECMAGVHYHVTRTLPGSNSVPLTPEPLYGETISAQARRIEELEAEVKQEQKHTWHILKRAEWWEDKCHGATRVTAKVCDERNEAKDKLKVMEAQLELLVEAAEHFV